VRDRLKRHLRERLRQLKEQQKRGTGERDARDAETPTVAPTPRRKSPKSGAEGQRAASHMLPSLGDGRANISQVIVFLNDHHQ